MQLWKVVPGAFAIAVVLAANADAGVSAADKCESSKLKAAGKSCACRDKIAAKALLTGTTPDYTKCVTKLADAFARAEAKGAGACPNASEASVVDGRLSALTSAVSTALDAASGTDPRAAKCVAAKLGSAGKECACVFKAQSTSVRKATAPDFAKCDAKVAAAFTTAETKYGAACPTTSDVDSISDLQRATFAEVEADIANRDTDDYASRGPYGVGIRTLTIVDASRPTAPNGSYPGAPERTLTVDVWYPVDLVSFPLPQNVDAPFTLGAGPFPLILRAHGFAGFRNDSIYLTQQLASYGYVVVAPDFPLSNFNAPGGPTLADVGEQALDLGFLIDTFTALNADMGSVFFGRIDTDTIGAIGHSLGGATVALATYHVTLRDPRIDATVALSPLACVFLDGFFDSATTPLMIEGGTVDMITPYTSNQLTPFGFVNAPKYLVELHGGTHLGFADRIGFTAQQNGDDAIGCNLFIQPGDPRPKPIESGLPPDFLGGSAAFLDPTGGACEPICPPPPATFMLHARQNRLAKAGALAFFDAKLRGSVSGARMITGRIDLDNADVALTYEE
jgi:predicted dienelactone hydrolase